MVFGLYRVYSNRRKKIVDRIKEISTERSKLMENIFYKISPHQSIADYKIRILELNMEEQKLRDEKRIRKFYDILKPIF